MQTKREGPPNGNREETNSATRRSFLKWSGAAAASAVALGAGSPNLDITAAFAQRGATLDGPVDLGSGDIGILNYAYALEQLEAAFYTIVVERPYRGMSRYERSILHDIRNHEVTHREFFRRALGPNRIPSLAVNFSAVDFSSRESVLTTARTFEDLGVSAYNGAGQYLRNPNYLVAAGRIVSVEARHAAIIRDIIAPLSPAFAGDDVVNPLGLDVENSPGFVLSQAGPFITTPISGGNVGV